MFQIEIFSNIKDIFGEKWRVKGKDLALVLKINYHNSSPQNRKVQSNLPRKLEKQQSIKTILSPLINLVEIDS